MIWEISYLQLNASVCDFIKQNDCLSFSPKLKVTIIDFRKAGRQGLKNEDKVGQKSLKKKTR